MREKSLDLEIESANLVGISVSGEDGVAHLDLTIPEGIPQLDIRGQAAQLRRISNVIVTQTE